MAMLKQTDISERRAGLLGEISRTVLHYTLKLRPHCGLSPYGCGYARAVAFAKAARYVSVLGCKGLISFSSSDLGESDRSAFISLLLFGGEELGQHKPFQQLGILHVAVFSLLDTRSISNASGSTDLWRLATTQTGSPFDLHTE